MKQINSRIQLKVDSAANWTSSNPTLLMGEVGFESDTGRYKVGDGATSWVSLGYKNEENTIKLARDNSVAIVDVLELPTENIDEEKFYRIQQSIFLLHGERIEHWVCYIVDHLPEIGEDGVVGDLSGDFSQFTVTTYYNIVDNEVYVFLSEQSGAIFGVPGGWYPFGVMSAAVGIEFGGFISEPIYDENDYKLYILMEQKIFIYKNKWHAFGEVGRIGTGLNSTVFNDLLNEATGDYSHAEGSHSRAGGMFSHAEGSEGAADGQSSHVEGQLCYAQGYASHAEGGDSGAVGDCSHAEGSHSRAEGEGSHAEGYRSHAQGLYSHAEGYETKAFGDYSHSGGLLTIANAESQTTIGAFNKENDQALFVIGNGSYYGLSNWPSRSEATLSNAFEVLRDGRAKSFGTPTENNDLTTVDYVSKKLEEESESIRGYIGNQLMLHATKDYVDAEVLAAKNYVDAEIDGLDIYKYATKEYVDNVKDYVDTEIEELNIYKYATKEYVNDEFIHANTNFNINDNNLTDSICTCHLESIDNSFSIWFTLPNTGTIGTVDGYKYLTTQWVNAWTNKYGTEEEVRIHINYTQDTPDTSDDLVLVKNMSWEDYFSVTWGDLKKRYVYTQGAEVNKIGTKYNYDITNINEIATTPLVDLIVKNNLESYSTKDYVDNTLKSYATETYVNTQIAALVDSAPEALNTLGELATALNNHEDAYDALLETVGNKVDKITGKQLSTNDFTNDYKSQLDSLKNFEETDPTVPSWAKQANKPTYTAAEVGALPSTTTLANLTTDSTHRTVTDAEKDAWNKKSNFSGNYNDLTNKPAPVDLSGYYTKTEVDNQIQALTDRLDALKIYDYSYEEN